MFLGLTLVPLGSGRSYGDKVHAWSLEPVVDPSVGAHAGLYGSKCSKTKFHKAGVSNLELYLSFGFDELGLTGNGGK